MLAYKYLLLQKGDKMNARDRDYIFVSYSHKDAVERYVKFFSQRNCNLIFDEAMSLGDEWDLKARRYISSNLCKGVIVLLSKDSMLSKPVLEEIELAERNRKGYFAVMTDDLSVVELVNYAASLTDENKRYVAQEVLKFFPPEKLFVKDSDLDAQWGKVLSTLQGWGYVPDKSEDEYVTTKYSSEIKGEKERLLSQQTGYYREDMRAIESVLESFDREGLCVIDLGCSNGALAASRFADIEKVTTVIGLDYNSNDIAEANRANYGEKFSFYRVDLDDANVIDDIKEILKQKGRENVDIVFSALTLHHLQNPKKLLLKLYDVFADDGKIILRGSDDGNKLCHPGGELLQEIVNRYDSYVKTSDRFNGRKLYEQLYNTGYVNIRMQYNVTDTCQKTRREKERLFVVGYGYRYSRVEEIMRLNPENKRVQEEGRWLIEALDKFREIFCATDFWYSVVTFIAIAGVS